MNSNFQPDKNTINQLTNKPNTQFQQQVKPGVHIGAITGNPGLIKVDMGSQELSKLWAQLQEQGTT